MESDLKQLVKSLNARLTNLEDGFSSTHEKEGLYERLRGLEKFRSRVYKFAAVVVAGVVSIALKLLFL